MIFFNSGTNIQIFTNSTIVFKLFLELVLSFKNIFINIVYEFKKQVKKFNRPVLNKVVKF